MASKKVLGQMEEIGQNLGWTGSNCKMWFCCWQKKVTICNSDKNLMDLWISQAILLSNLLKCSKNRTQSSVKMFIQFYNKDLGTHRRENHVWIEAQMVTKNVKPCCCAIILTARRSEVFALHWQWLPSICLFSWVYVVYNFSPCDMI